MQRPKDGFSSMRKFDSLSEREMLALAITLEEDDERTYADYAERQRESFPGSAAIFAMRILQPITANG